MEHRLLTGGGEEYLPFARSCVAKLKKLGTAYANQAFEVNGVSIKVRIEPGHEYVRIDGGGYASVFPTVQVPSAISKTDWADPGRIRIGTFDAARVPSDRHTRPHDDMTWFGKSPYVLDSIRRTVSTFKYAYIDINAPVFMDWPLNLGQHNDFIVGGEVVSSETHTPALKSTRSYTIPAPAPVGAYGSSEGGGRWESWGYRVSQLAHCISSGRKPILATFEVDAAYEEYHHTDPTVGVEFSDAWAAYLQWHGSRVVGSSFVRLRVLSTRTAEDGTQVSEINALDVGRLTYSTDTRQTTLLGQGSLPYDTITESVTISNDIMVSWVHRTWHATTRVNVAPDGGVFVLRETNYVNYQDAGDRNQVTGAPLGPQRYSNTVNRGYSLSFVTPDGTVMDNKVVGDIGRFGYIDGVIPSSDNARVYVYYGVHDTSEVMPEITITNFDQTCPVKYLEYIDEVAVVNTNGTYSLSKQRTIALGAVTLRYDERMVDVDGWGVLVRKMDHYESKLHGAALAVSGYIWSDRYCYSIDNNEFYPLPEYTDPIPEDLTVVNMALYANLQQSASSPRFDRNSYIYSTGDAAKYFRLWFGEVASYEVRKDQEAGTTSVVLKRRQGVSAGGYSTGETTTAAAARFSK